MSGSIVSEVRYAQGNFCSASSSSGSSTTKSEGTTARGSFSSFTVSLLVTVFVALKTVVLLAYCKQLKRRYLHSLKYAS